MKIAAVSDLHIDLLRKTDYALNTIEEVLNTDAELLLVGGDVGYTKKGISEGLEKLSQFKGPKLAFLGNHELKSLENSTLENYLDEMNDLFSKYNFHLLDKEPFIYQNVGFIGNVGWYDYSFYDGDYYKDNPDKEKFFFYTQFKTGKLTPQEFLKNCFERVKQHHSTIVDKCDKIVLGVHHIGFKEFLRLDAYYPKSLHGGMGSKQIAELYMLPKVVWGICGHTHRSKRINYNGIDIDNVSSDANQQFLIKDI